jgi:hypothetical protein
MSHQAGNLRPYLISNTNLLEIDPKIRMSIIYSIYPFTTEKSETQNVFQKNNIII